MDGKNCLSQKQILQDISTNKIDLTKVNENLWFSVFPHAFLTHYIFKQSIIDIAEYYKTCVLISYKTANSQQQIDDMPFYVFNNFVVYLNEIIEEENKSENGNGNESGQDMMKSASGMMNSQMANAKNMFNKNLKLK